MMENKNKSVTNMSTFILRSQIMISIFVSVVVFNMMKFQARLLQVQVGQTKESQMSRTG